MSILSNSNTPINYVNGFVYQNNELDFFANETGRVLKVAGGFERQYVIDKCNPQNEYYTSLIPTT